MVRSLVVFLVNKYTKNLIKRGYKVDKKQIVITDSLSSIGMFYVDVVLHKKVICKLGVELKK